MAEVSMSVADVGQFRRDPSGWCSHLPCVRASSHCPGHEGVHDSSRPAGHQQRLVRLPNSRTAADLMQRAPHSRLAVPCTVGEGLERLYEGRVAGDLPSLETTGTLRARHICSALRRPARCDPGRWRCDPPRYQQQCSRFSGWEPVWCVTVDGMARDMSIAFVRACDAYVAQQEAVLTGLLAAGALRADVVVGLRAQLDQMAAQMRAAGAALHVAAGGGGQNPARRQI